MATGCISGFRRVITPITHSFAGYAKKSWGNCYYKAVGDWGYGLFMV